jgi:hypothetical protein
MTIPLTAGGTDGTALPHVIPVGPFPALCRGVPAPGRNIHRGDPYKL